MYEACRRIWEGYKMYAGTAFVMRRGVENVGLAKLTESNPDVVETFRRRGESIMEHQARTAWLFSAFFSNFPDIFQYAPVSAFYMMVAMLSHDVGEIATGDIPDDGNPLHGTKDAVEYEMFQKMTQAYTSKTVAWNQKERLDFAFSGFQLKDFSWGKALYAMDKLEAVLHLLYLEIYDYYGDVTRNASMTELDRESVKFTGSVCATDCWAVHLKSQIMDFPKCICNPVFCLLEVAVRDVRGEMFDWWNRDISDTNILP